MTVPDTYQHPGTVVDAQTDFAFSVVGQHFAKPHITRATVYPSSPFKLNSFAIVAVEVGASTATQSLAANICALAPQTVLAPNQENKMGSKSPR
jgi:hypothetical protein